MGRVTPYSCVVGKSDCPAEAIMVLTNLPAKAPPKAPAAPNAATVRARGPSVSTLTCATRPLFNSSFACTYFVFGPGIS